MKYKVIVKKVEEIDGDKYPRESDIYEQIVDELDITSIIMATNSIKTVTKVEKGYTDFIKEGRNVCFTDDQLDFLDKYL